MDAFLGYNQIQMSLADHEKTSFITNQGLYCYNVMLFGFKNASATYRCLVNVMFNDKIGKTLEVYLDDMFVEIQRGVDYVHHLEETFIILR